MPRPICREQYIERIANALDDLALAATDWDKLDALRKVADRVWWPGKEQIVEAARLLRWPVDGGLAGLAFFQEFLTDTPIADRLMIEALDDDTPIRVADLLDGALRRLGIVHTESACC
jgi:hypothetical protein